MHLEAGEGADFPVAVIPLVAVIVEAIEVEGEGMHHTKGACRNSRRSIALLRDALLNRLQDNVSLGHGIKRAVSWFLRRVYNMTWWSWLSEDRKGSQCIPRSETLNL